MLITFSGLDGAGKSTVIRRVQETLEARGRPAVVRHMTYDLGVLATAMTVHIRLLGVAGHGRRGERRSGHASGTSAAGGAAAATSRWRRLRSAIVWNKPLRRAIYLVDLMIFSVYRLYTERVRRRVLIMDRYFYDTLVDVAEPGGWRWARFLLRITPVPSLAVFLRTTPEEAFARKQEFSVEYLTRRSLVYQRVLEWVPSAVVLDNVDLSRTAGEITRLVEQRAHGPGTHEGTP
ncbi:MAG: hypothetical protein ACREOQ_20985 [Gemmatimonadales bacterium]